jgi:DNA mismatch endonuclease (patch repair protein)
VVVKAKSVIFVDGDFWHGRRWTERRAKLTAGANASYWVAKIERNRERDRAIRRKLKQLGWCVIRVWESDVKRDPDKVAGQILLRLISVQP